MVLCHKIFSLWLSKWFFLLIYREKCVKIRAKTLKLANQVVKNLSFAAGVQKKLREGGSFMKRYVSFCLLLMVLFAAPCFAEEMGQIAIFTESVGWTSVGAANTAAQIILDGVTITNDIQKLGNGDMGTFAEANTDDGELDIIILFGYFPPSLYTPGNGQPDGSVGELFLEGGNMFLNTSDYIFYVSSANNDAGGLTNMTDSNFDCWTDGITNSPTEDGDTYTPSYAGHVGKRSFQINQVAADADWELEVVFGSDGANTADPAIIRNLTYNGRVGVVLQVDNNAVPRGEVLTEILNDWLPTVVSAKSVKPVDKLSVTWGEVKRSF